ncbi:MAG TPA: NAD(P)H-hydrate dehydratase [Vicinamibacterales bacterium]|nr:NAD(P)H-hydrate dehydratase [Vicinamibacterales bacterium]
MRILNAEQMREADRRTIQDIGIASLVLMENAGRQAVAAIESLYPDLAERQIAIVCGKGNNGGDGFVIARTLQQRGFDVSVFVIGSAAEIKGDARVNLEILSRIGQDVVEVTDETAWELHGAEVTGHDLIVDAIFGTGLATPLSGFHQTVVADINDAGVPVVAIDIPSGMSADTADVIGDCIDATVTVTLGAPKLPLVLPPAEMKAGEVVIADIGIPAGVIDQLEGPRIDLLTRDRMRTLIPPRAPDAHKGDFGRVLVVAGSMGKAGAAVLCAQGAMRAGAGLVTVASPRSCQPTIAAHAAEYMTEGLDETADGTVGRGAVERVLAIDADVIVAGPGLGRGDAVRAFARELLDRHEGPLVLDADALNAFADEPALLVGREGRDLIITPHPGEMARLVGCSVDDLQADRIGIAADFAKRHKLYVVLKGYRTLVVTPDERVFVNPTGCPGMATGGTGDVLAGMIGAWLAQLLDAEAACTLAVYLHGSAGELADADSGEVAMTAGDLIDHIGDAILEVSARRRVAASKSE